jgi:hypothetical protein
MVADVSESASRRSGADGISMTLEHEWYQLYTSATEVSHNTVTYRNAGIFASQVTYNSDIQLMELNSTLANIDIHGQRGENECIHTISPTYTNNVFNVHKQYIRHYLIAYSALLALLLCWLCQL